MGGELSEGVTICCPGYGAGSEIANTVRAQKVLAGDFFGLDFLDPAQRLFGTFDEIRPLVSALKRTVCDNGVAKINLYGYSAGGGAVVNALAALHGTAFDEQLSSLDIFAQEKERVFRALEAGVVILDCPLKSVEEIMVLRGETPEFVELAANYASHGMRPIDAVLALSGVKLTIILHFQEPDEILGNRDDLLFIERVRRVNLGVTHVVIGRDGGHVVHHAALWDFMRTRFTCDR